MDNINLNSLSYKIRRRLLFGCSRLLPDRFYLKHLFPLVMGYPLDLKHPQTFNEKQQWLKLYDRRPEYTQMVDKYEVKKLVASKIGEEYVVPTIATYKRAEEIMFEDLPDQFVIKCTHDSGSVYICRDINAFNRKLVIEKFKFLLKKNYYWKNREWPYKHVTPQIIVDQYLDDKGDDVVRDYKFWCFNGKPYVMYCTNKGKDIYENFYDMSFRPLSISHGFRKVEKAIEKPKSFELMKELAAQLSENIPFVRVDFFNIDDHVYFGEFTFYDWGGLKPFIDKSWDYRIGEWLRIPERYEAR